MTPSLEIILRIHADSEVYRYYSLYTTIDTIVQRIKNPWICMNQSLTSYIKPCKLRDKPAANLCINPTTLPSIRSFVGLVAISHRESTFASQTVQDKYAAEDFFLARVLHDLGR